MNSPCDFFCVYKTFIVTSDCYIYLEFTEYNKSTIFPWNIVVLKYSSIKYSSEVGQLQNCISVQYLSKCTQLLTTSGTIKHMRMSEHTKGS